MLLSLPFIDGCSQDNTNSKKLSTTTHKNRSYQVQTAKEISRIESAITLEVSERLNKGSYGSNSKNYEKVFNLLSVKIINKTINIYLKTIPNREPFIMEDVMHTIDTASTYTADKMGLKETSTNIYIDNKSFNDIVKEEIEGLK